MVQKLVKESFGGVPKLSISLKSPNKSQPLDHLSRDHLPCSKWGMGSLWVVLGFCPIPIFRVHTLNLEATAPSHIAVAPSGVCVLFMTLYLRKVAKIRSLGAAGWRL